MQDDKAPTQTTDPVAELRRSIDCLYLEVSPSIVEDLRAKIAAAIAAERERCAQAASWAIHDVGLRPNSHNLELRELINRAVLAAIGELK